MSRFLKTYCSQCGGEFGPGDEGYSHCSDHARTDCLPIPADRNQGWGGVYAILYTDEINGEQTCRDDLWVATTKAINDAQHNAYAEGRKDEAEERAWRPIETAPEDENVLVATEGGHVDAAFWTDDGDGPKWWWLVSANEYAKHPLHPNLVPTHWMPLPKHPTRVATTIGKR